MTRNYKSGDFSKYFKENMNALNLPVPSQLFDTFSSAVANAALMAEALSTLGTGATIGELIKATTGLEKLKVVAGLGAAYYVGAVIGSIAVATGRSLSGGTSIADFFVFQQRHGLNFKGSRHFYLTHQEILNPSRIGRAAFKTKASLAAGVA